MLALNYGGMIWTKKIQNTQNKLKELGYFQTNLSLVYLFGRSWVKRIKISLHY